jgi:hypothetical protein
MDQVLMWEGIITQLAPLGVKSFQAIRALMQDAGLDDATIAQLSVKWDDLYNRVKAASGQ